MMEIEDIDFSSIVRADIKGFEDQDNNLRPKMLRDFLGQENIKSNLSTFIEAAKALYESHSVEDITRHEADKVTTDRTISYILDVISVFFKPSVLSE